jgi:uncharacterized membrane protein (DUF106 family)
MMGLSVVSLPLGAELTVIIIGVVYTIASVLLQRKLTNPKRMRELQAQIKKLTNELNALVKNNASKELQTAKQSEVMKLMGESMRASFKPMFVALPMFVLLFYFLLPALPLGTAGSGKSAQTVFFYTALGMGLLSTLIITLYDRKMIKKEEQLLKVDAENLQKAESGDLSLKTRV